MEYNNNNKGVAFRNETATPENKQPYLSGSATIDGKEKRVAMWLNEAKDGRKYFSMKFSEPQAKEVVASNDSSTSSTGDVPF